MFDIERTKKEPRIQTARYLQLGVSRTLGDNVHVTEGVANTPQDIRPPWTRS